MVIIRMKTKTLKKLQNNGVEVVLTNLDKLSDSNSAYSAVWRTFFRWYVQEGKGWLPNPLASEAPKVTVRSYLELFNVKANHRKMIATENAALVTSGNPHDASGFFMNIAFKVKGDIIHDIVEEIARASGRERGKRREGASAAERER